MGADEGTWGGSSISNRARDERWWDSSGNAALTQTGNWARHRLDLDGNGTFASGGELDDARAHNNPNEILTRDVDNNSSTDYTLVYNKRGDLTDDNQAYKFEYDAFGRLRKIKNQSNNLVAEYTYNGLGHRIGWHYDVDADATVENTSDDPWFYFAYDDRWRIVATFRDTDQNPKETFIYHAAGLDGRGGSSYIDSVILIDQDMTNGWAGAADGTRELRWYPLQNWRADVVCTIGAGGWRLESVRYSSYGTPDLLPVADWDVDGDIDSADSSAYVTTYGGGGIAADVNFNGSVSSQDLFDFTAIKAMETQVGRGFLSNFGIRKGYAGYENDGNIVRMWHVRNRMLDSMLGRWTRRDLLPYADGLSFYQYASGASITAKDPSGLLSNWEFLRWYFTGFGATYSFSPSEVMTYRSHSEVARVEASIRSEVETSARSAANALHDSLTCACQSNHWHDDEVLRLTGGRRIDEGNFVIVWPLMMNAWRFWNDYTFSLGDHIIEWEATCNLATWCAYSMPPSSDGSYDNVHYQCQIHYAVRDWFRDPLDFGDMYRWAVKRLFGWNVFPPEGNIEIPTGIAYRIHIHWSDVVADSWFEASAQQHCKSRE